MNDIQRDSLAATLVAEDNRLLFLPSFFGPKYMLRGEALVYGWMDRLCESYNGGYWHFYDTTNGACYMVLAAMSKTAHKWRRLSPSAGTKGGHA